VVWWMVFKSVGGCKPRASKAMEGSTDCCVSLAPDDGQGGTQPSDPAAVREPGTPRPRADKGRLRESEGKGISKT
jgi:hypothetical protein